jgi:hypothetical protein
VLVLTSFVTQFLHFDERFLRFASAPHVVVAPCLAHHMAVVVDKDNLVGNVTSTHLAKIFRAEAKKWPDGRDIVLVFHTASSGEKSTLERLMKMSDGELQSLITATRIPSGWLLPMPRCSI